MLVRSPNLHRWMDASSIELLNSNAAVHNLQEGSLSLRNHVQSSLLYYAGWLTTGGLGLCRCTADVPEWSGERLYRDRVLTSRLWVHTRVLEGS